MYLQRTELQWAMLMVQSWQMYFLLNIHKNIYYNGWKIHVLRLLFVKVTFYTFVAQIYNEIIWTLAGTWTTSRAETTPTFLFSFFRFCCEWKWRRLNVSYYYVYKMFQIASLLNLFYKNKFLFWTTTIFSALCKLRPCFLLWSKSHWQSVDFLS